MDIFPRTLGSFGEADIDERFYSYVYVIEQGTKNTAPFKGTRKAPGG